MKLFFGFFLIFMIILTPQVFGELDDTFEINKKKNLKLDFNYMITIDDKKYYFSELSISEKCDASKGPYVWQSCRANEIEDNRGRILEYGENLCVRTGIQDIVGYLKNDLMTYVMCSNSGIYPNDYASFADGKKFDSDTTMELWNAIYPVLDHDDEELVGSQSFEDSLEGENDELIDNEPVTAKATTYVDKCNLDCMKTISDWTSENPHEKIPREVMACASYSGKPMKLTQDLPEYLSIFQGIVDLFASIECDTNNGLIHTKHFTSGQYDQITNALDIVSKATQCTRAQDCIDD